MKKHIIVSLALTMGLAAINAQTTETTVVTEPGVTQKTTVVEESDYLFRAQELSIDLFGTVSVGKHTLEHFSPERVRESGELGLGAGVNYFFLRQLGIGADAYSTDVNHIFVENASANLIFRIPIEAAHLAPYVYGGGGYQWEPGDEWFGQVGGGVDIRVTHNWGLFVDGRYVMPHHGGDFGVFRGGLRFAF